MFNYILIEASGVSEPSEIAPMFEPCDDEHDHEDEHPEGPQLSEVARLDTCVTVVDAAEFYNNLESMKVYDQNDIEGTITELLMEQIEFSNVIVLNKKDLVNAEQLGDIEARISLLNPKAKIVMSCQSKIDVMEILNTGLYSREEMEEGGVMMSATRVDNNEKNDEKEELPTCCIKSVDDGKIKCCKSKNKNLIDSGLSTILLGVVADKNNKTKANLTRHEERFGITSFIYRARRPFHPGRLDDLLLEPFFMLKFLEEEDDENGEDEKSKSKDNPPQKKMIELEKLQEAPAAKQTKRVDTMGELLRSKGFIWIATSHHVMGGWQQAGNIIRLEAENPWMCEIREMWEDTPSAELVYKDMNQPNGEEWPYADRRQELVFIGHGLKNNAIQGILDSCLLNDEEMSLGPEAWAESMAEVDKIQLSLEDSDDEEEGEEENDEGENEAKEQNELSEESVTIPTKKRKKK